MAKARNNPKKALKKVEERCIHRLGSFNNRKKAANTSDRLGRTKEERNQREANSQPNAIRNKPRPYLKRLEQIEVLIRNGGQTFG